MEDSRREHYRKMSTGVEESAMSPRQLASWQFYAKAMIVGLREEFPDLSDDHLSVFAANVAKLYATLQHVPVMSLSEAVDNTMSAYMLAAGNLAGVYQIPATGSPDADAASAASASPATPEPPPTGQYL